MDKRQTTTKTPTAATKITANAGQQKRSGKNEKIHQSAKQNEERLKDQQQSVNHSPYRDHSEQTKKRQGPTANLAHDTSNRLSQPFNTDKNKNSNSKKHDKAKAVDQLVKKPSSSSRTNSHKVESIEIETVERSKRAEKGAKGSRKLLFDGIVDNFPDGELSAFLAKSGLNDMQDYAVLSSEYFVKNLADAYCCCLCCCKLKDSQSIDVHLGSQQHILEFLKLRSKILQIIPSDSSLQSASVGLLLNSWIQDKALTTELREERAYAISEFCIALAEISPGSQYRIIGSFLTGCSLVDSDINVEVLHPNTKLFESDPRAKNSIHHKLVDPDAEYGCQINYHTLHYDLIENAVSTLYKVAKCLAGGYSSIKSFTVESTVEDLNTKVPELVLKYEPTGTILRVCCYAESSYKLACLLRNYLSLDERALMLSILVKSWARICRISNPNLGTCSPDTLVILVIYFLQRTEPPILPCLHELLGKNGQSKNEEKGQKLNDNLVDKLNKLNLNQPNCDTEESAGASNEFSEVEAFDNNLDRQPADEEFEDDCDDDGICNEFDSSLIENLEWSTENTSSVSRLFIEFLKFSMIEFADLNTVISIRSLSRVTLRSKGWYTEVKAIENPVKPKLNLSRTIGSRRVFEYIRQCFAHGFYYLTSLNNPGKNQRESCTDPTDYSELFIDLNKLDFYFNMRAEKIMTSYFDTTKEMMQQEMFAKDIDIITYAIEHFAEHKRNLELLPLTFARSYNTKQLVPRDVNSTVFCWICRGYGHSRSNCPDRKLGDFSRINPNDPIDMKINFDNGFLKLYKDDMITQKIAEKHKSVVQILTNVIRTGTGLKCNLTLFGSTVNLLGSRDSDLDICMTLDDNPTGRDVDCAAILSEVNRLLDQNERIRQIEPILSARVPIIRFCYGNTAETFDVDLSMYNQCAIHNSRLLRTYVLIEPRLAQLFYLVKRYAKACGIADASRGSLSSYAWSLLVIHFMQNTNPPMLPVLQEPLDGGQKPMFGVNGWNVWFNEDIESISLAQSDTNLTTLFKQFLLYYANFDFTSQVVSIRTSKLMSKFQKNWNNCMIAIEDPFELTYNLSGRLDESMALYIMKSFSSAYNNIHKIQLECLAKMDIYPQLNVIRSIFVGEAIMDSPPPYRGCRRCHKIGHRVKECPMNSKKSEPRRVNKQGRMK